MSTAKKIVISLVLAITLLTIAGYYALRALHIISNGDYDETPPNIGEIQRPAILVLSKANGFVHTDALPAGEKMLRELANDNGWNIYATNNAASHNSEDLRKFDAVVWNNVSGDVLTITQRQAFKDWLEQGGGWVGIHASGGDLFYEWDWYVNTLIGAQFIGHTSDPQFQDANVIVNDSSNELTSHLTSSWTVPKEEWYAFDSNPQHKGYEILLNVDESSYITQDQSLIWKERMDGEHPITWRHKLNKGRVFYSAIGHQGATYSIPEFRQLIKNAIQWAGSIPAQ